jgi:outer membrane protein TolC
MEVEKAKIAQAADALRIAEDRYQGGLLSATDLVDAQNGLESARLNYLQLVYNHIMSTYTLFRSCGRKI